MKRKCIVFLSIALSTIFVSNTFAGSENLTPARQILEGLGFVSQWDSETKTAVFKNEEYTISVTAGSDYFEVNGKKIKSEGNVPVIENGSFLLPQKELLKAINVDLAENDTKIKKVITLDNQLLKDIEGITNARQLGGYVNTEGKKIKQNVILRTGKPSDATNADIELLSKKYKVSDMVDFRTIDEAQIAPEPTVEGATNHHIPLNIAGDMKRIVTDEFKQAYIKATKSGDNGEIVFLLAENKMLPTPEMYGYFLSDEAAEGYKQFFEILLNKPEDASVLFHCTQGKDRTGMGAALFLYALDFDDETVMADYLLTNEANAERIKKDVESASKHTDDPKTIELVKTMNGVNAPCLQAALDEMKEKYGSVKGYLKTRLGLTDNDFAKLKEMYME